jgi:nuclear pore complex protein Nup107
VGCSPIRCSCQHSSRPRLIGPLVRFFAHLILVLRSLGRTVPEEQSNDILKAYLYVLEQEGNDSLVAMYAACLREGSGEASYARFLKGEWRVSKLTACDLDRRPE